MATVQNDDHLTSAGNKSHSPLLPVVISIYNTTSPPKEKNSAAVKESMAVDSVLGNISSTIITIAEERTVQTINSGIRNRALNPDLNNNIIKPDSISIASTNHRNIPTYVLSDTLTTTEDNREIKELAKQLENNVQEQ